MGSLVRAAALRGLPELVDRLGGDSHTLLARHHVPPAAVDTDDALIPAATAGRVLESAAARLQCPDLGLRLAEQQDTGVLGPLAVAIENSPTLGSALECASRFLFVHSPALRVAQIPDPEGRPAVVGLYYGSAEPQPLPPQVVDLGLGLFHRIIVLLHGGGYGLRTVHLPHPPIAPVSRYVEFFGTDTRFERPAAVLRVPVQLLGAPVPGGNRLLRDVALDYLGSHFSAPEQTVTARVRLLLTRSLGTAPVSLASIARLVQTHPRTLQRRLAAEGTSFEATLDDVRRDAAHHLITRTDLPFTQVTGMVGLTEQSALTRAAHRWFGRSPRALRACAAVPDHGLGADDPFRTGERR